MLGRSKKKNRVEAESPKDEGKAKKPAAPKKKGKEADVDDESKVKRSDQIKISIGVLFLAFVIIMVVSFISYFFTWESDQSLSNYGFFEALFNSDIQVENKAGKLGAIIANFFIRDTFGIASFAIVAMLVVISLRLLKIRKVRILPFIIKSAVIMLWFSIAFASIFKDSLFMLGGKHGYFLFNGMRNLVGGIGAYSIIVVLALLVVVFCFENSVVGIKKILERISAFRIKDIKEKLGEEEETTDSPQNTDEPKPIDPILPIEPAPTAEPVEPEPEKPTTIDFDGDETGKDDKVPQPPVSLDDGFEINHGGDEEPDNNNDETIEVVDTPVEVDVPENPVADGDGNVELDITEATEEPQVNPDDWTNLPDYDPTMDLEFYKFPTADLLPDIQPKDKLSDEELKLQLNANKDRIVQTLSDYGIAISKISATVGPTVTLYEIVPAPGVRISKIKNLEDDIALSLAALGIRIIAPIPGKGTIGIEVPNPKPETVSMRSVISSKKFQESKYDLPVALGKTITNETYVFNLAKTPHLLVAGATGQGKSVGINAIIASLLYKKHPSQLKFVLVDPKMVELSIYKAIEKHYLAKLPGDNPAIITDVSKVTEAMNSLCILMDERYELLTKAGCRNINEYNEKFIKRKLNPEKGHYYMFYIVVVIDEFADIIVQEGRQVETPISRLAAKARAIGIHLIVATQRPSTNVITGVIKANFPSRIAFKVTNYIDSKTILDQTGANQLIGRGDLLISYGGEITRVQCAFIDTPEVQSLVDFISAQQGYPCVYELPEVKGEGGEDGMGSGATLDPNNRDPLFDEAARLICESQQGSTSMLQRKFSIGYNRAGKIIDQLEAAGIVGPYEGSKARQVLYDITSLERYLEVLHGNN
ncbi:MAG: DNA translocase FtsK 4TM domain-containing protein [Bacteroidales bacterium]|nr:DNA translocase FtsK 4TM domain-containing protein [Bacteroidales bacterium]